MNRSLNAIRREVDLIRAATKSGQNFDQGSGRADLNRVATILGRDEIRVDSDMTHAGGHRCPWHTCQATRH